jgi:hypothetical protein
MSKKHRVKISLPHSLAPCDIVKTPKHTQQNENTIAPGIKHLLKNTSMLKVGGRRYSKPFIT